MAPHDLGQLRPIRRAAGCRPEHLERLAEILGSDGCGGDHAQCFRVLSTVIVEPMNRAARDTQRLSRSNVNRFPVDRPRQGTFEAINGFFVVIVAMRRRRQAVTAADGQLEGRDAARGVGRGDQEADRERPAPMVSSAGLTESPIARASMGRAPLGR